MRVAVAVIVAVNDGFRVIVAVKEGVRVLVRRGVADGVAVADTVGVRVIARTPAVGDATAWATTCTICCDSRYNGLDENESMSTAGKRQSTSTAKVTTANIMIWTNQRVITTSILC